jgi:hypothetical protein
MTFRRLILVSTCRSAQDGDGPEQPLSAAREKRGETAEQAPATVATSSTIPSRTLISCAPVPAR